MSWLEIALVMEQMMVVVKEGMQSAGEEDSELWGRGRACTWQDSGAVAK